jgi:ubiquinol-cytochrome c reductase cytochrome b subunit
VFGHTISWSVLLPGAVLPVVLLVAFLAFPFIESWVTGDKREHHLLDRPRNAPTRTAFLVAMMTLYGLLWAAGGNDILAVVFALNLNYITWFMRVAIFVGPVIAFIIARRWCISLQRQDEGKLLHGYETGVIMRSPEGAYSERHLPISEAEAYTLIARDRDVIHELPEGVDENGVAAPNARADRLRAKLSRFWFGSNVQKPTREALEEAHEHAAHELAVQSDGHQHLPAGDYEGDYELDGTAADGHQFDGRHPIEGEHLRQH